MTPCGETASATANLLSEHKELLKQSAISDEVIAERGYWSATKVVEFERLGYRRNSASVPALVIPCRGPDGLLAGYQARPSIPPVIDGRVVKYVSPPGAGVVLDVPPRCRPLIGSTQVPLWITEGSKKADALATVGLCAIGLLGVDCFSATAGIAWRCPNGACTSPTTRT